MEELNQGATSGRVFRWGIQDKSIQRILGMLMEELETRKPLGRPYVDSLVHALATRYILLDCAAGRKSESRVSGLRPRVLSRVRERIEANLDTDLSLDSLAGESGYSRAHFLRMFRVATGLTPHRYVPDLRLSCAQDRLREQGLKHNRRRCFVRFFQPVAHDQRVSKRLEMTPGEFRRNA